MNSIKEQVDTLLQKDLDRRQFLQYVGGVTLSFIGIFSFLKILLESQVTTPKKKELDGYGRSYYGR